MYNTRNQPKILNSFKPIKDPLVQTLNRHLHAPTNDKCKKDLWITYITHISQKTEIGCVTWPYNVTKALL